MRPDRSREERELTRKQRAHLRRDDIQRRWVLVGTGITLFIVIAIIGAGFLDQYVLQQLQPVAVVNGDSITTREFQVAVRYRRFQLIGQYNQTIQLASLLGSDPTTDTYIQQQLQQITSQLQSPRSVGRSALDQLIEDRLLRQEAKRRGITVSAAEVQQDIQAGFGFYPNGTPTASGPTPTVSPPTATPETPPTATATSTPGTPVPTGTAEPTATPYTAAGFQKDLSTYLAETKKATDMSEKEFRTLIESALYRRKVQAAITANLPPQADQVHARHILVGTEAEASALRDRLVHGEAWDALAAQYSLDTGTKDQAGDLGWFARGVMDPVFEAAAFSLAPGSISQPVQTAFGWHLINVVSHDIRPLSASALDSKATQVFQDWLTAEKAKSNAVKEYDIWKERVPAEPTLPPSAG